MTNGGKVPFDAEKAAAWNSRWEQRYAPQYARREEDRRHYPKPAVKPPTGPRNPAGAPHSADVIRELERQINGGKVLSP